MKIDRHSQSWPVQQAWHIWYLYYRKTASKSERRRIDDEIQKARDTRQNESDDLRPYEKKQNKNTYNNTSQSNGGKWVQCYSLRFCITQPRVYIFHHPFLVLCIVAKFWDQDCFKIFCYAVIYIEFWHRLVLDIKLVC